MLESVEAAGKNLLLHFDGGVVVRSHLRMSGRWRVERRGATRVGRPWLVLRGREQEGVLWNGPVLGASSGGRCGGDSGPTSSASDFDEAAAVARLRRLGDRRLGEALQYQRAVAGIGNMWMAEALWEIRVSPWARVERCGRRDARRSRVRRPGG